MTDLFQNFNGADLDRLAACLTAIRNAGLRVDRYTQAGINSSSGNVWVFSEDWQGCVCCSIGFDVAWSWSCPDCGEEFDFDSYRELEVFAEDNNDGQCAACREVGEQREAA